MRAILFGALGVALLGAGFWWFLSTYHQVPFDLRTPPSAAARRNRLLALEETLRTRGHQVFNQLRFDSQHFADPRASAVVLDLDPRALRDRDVDTLLQFVSDGALLLLRMPDSADGRPGALLDRLGIDPIEEEEARCFTIKIKDT